MAKAPTTIATNAEPETVVETKTVVIDNTDAPEVHAETAKVDSEVELGDGTVQVNYV